MTLLIILHTLGATIWVGGHLILSLSVLPEAWRKKDYRIIQAFEEKFERIGIPALLLQVITGLWMAAKYLPFSQWLNLDQASSSLIGIKLLLLLLTILLAVHARFFILPKMDDKKIPFLAVHILSVTLLGILLLITGLSFRLGFLFG